MVAAMRIDAYVTGATCGDACWHAREDVCRCSCNGANHGCLRTADGERPVRTARVKGRMMRLTAVGSYRTLHDIDPRLLWHADYVRARIGVYVRKASASEIAKWPELTAFRNAPDFQRWTDAAYLLWADEGVDYAPVPCTVCAGVGNLDDATGPKICTGCRGWKIEGAASANGKEG